MTLSGQNEQELLPFERRYKVRLLPFAQFARDLALMDTQQVLFDIDGPGYRELPTWQDGFSVTVTTSSDAPPGVDIIEIVDANSVLLDGSKLTMRFLREPSPPMIDPSFPNTGRYGAMWADCTSDAAVADPDEAVLECMFQDTAAGGVMHVRKNLLPSYEDRVCFNRDDFGQLVRTADCS
jgi:hypothetical protein